MLQSSRIQRGAAARCRDDRSLEKEEQELLKAGEKTSPCVCCRIRSSLSAVHYYITEVEVSIDLSYM